VVYATKIEFFDYKLPIATVPNDAILSVRRNWIFRSKRFGPKSYVDEAEIN
jgi:hypothetical protein